MTESKKTQLGSNIFPQCPHTGTKSSMSWPLPDMVRFKGNGRGGGKGSGLGLVGEDTIGLEDTS